MGNELMVIKQKKPKKPKKPKRSISKDERQYLWAGALITSAVLWAFIVFNILVLLTPIEKENAMIFVGFLLWSSIFWLPLAIASIYFWYRLLTSEVR